MCQVFITVALSPSTVLLQTQEDISDGMSAEGQGLAGTLSPPSHFPTCKDFDLQTILYPSLFPLWTFKVALYLQSLFVAGRESGGDTSIHSHCCKREVPLTLASRCMKNLDSSPTPECHYTKVVARTVFLKHYFFSVCLCFSFSQIFNCV